MTSCHVLSLAPAGKDSLFGLIKHPASTAKLDSCLSLTAMADNPFKYLPLDSGVTTIRLLHLLPGEAGSPLHCTIEHVLLAHNVKYVALSYAWKDTYLYPNEESTGTEHLMVNDDYCLLIGKNLASFLRQVRDAEKPPQTMWIDAICINQTDIRERNMHVIKMGDIYRKADKVIVWLGPHRDDSDLALEVLKTMEALGDYREEKKSQGEVRFWDNSDKTKLLELNQSKDAHRSWVGLVKLFGRAWWRRTWVVQEALLPRDFIFKCGNSDVNWSTIWHALENLWLHDQVSRVLPSAERTELTSSQWACEQLPFGKELLNACNPGRTLLWMRSNRDKGSRDLVQLLYHLRPSQSSDPKDKVYGVLGLASDGRQMVPEANYELKVERIYAKLYQTMSVVRGNLDWLTLATGVNNLELPSWCADLSKQSRYVSMNTCRSVLGDVPFGFCAAGDSKPQINIDLDSRHCSIKGYMFDEVDGLGGCQDPGAPNAELLQPSTGVSAYPDDAAILEAIWMTLVADQDFEGTPTAWKAPAKFGTLYLMEAQMTLNDLESNGEALGNPSAFQIWVQRNAALVIDAQTVAERTKAERVYEPADGSTLDALAGFHRRLQSTVKNRRFIVTKRGYIGIANDDVRRGDKVCLLHGSRMPVILRQVEENFAFFGEAYVHGMMQGELWPCADLPDVEAREFCVL